MTTCQRKAREREREKEREKERNQAAGGDRERKRRTMKGETRIEKMGEKKNFVTAAEYLG